MGSAEGISIECRMSQKNLKLTTLLMHFGARFCIIRRLLRLTMIRMYFPRRNKIDRRSVTLAGYHPPPPSLL